VDENQEQQTNTEEAQAKASAQEPKVEPSKEAGKASEGKKEGATEAGKAEKEGEVDIDERIRRAAQSMTDKQLKGIYEFINEYRAEAKERKAQEERTKAEALEQKMIEEWKESGLPEETIKAYSDAKKELTEKVNKYNTEYLPQIKSGIAFTLATESIKEILPDGEDIVHALNEFIEAIKVGKDETEMKSIAKAKALDFKNALKPQKEAEPTKEARKRPDSSFNAGGSLALGELSPKERVRKGEEILKKH